MTKQERLDWGWQELKTGASTATSVAARQRFDFLYDTIAESAAVEAHFPALAPILRIQGQAADLAAQAAGSAVIGPTEIDASTLLVGTASDTSFCKAAIDRIA